MLTVRGSGRSDQTALWEVDPKHPGGEIFLSESSAETQVGDTMRVREAILMGKLVLVSDGVPDPPPEPPGETGGGKGSK